LKILDGKRGAILSLASLPPNLFVKAAPQLFRLKSGQLSVIFGTEEKVESRIGRIGVWQGAAMGSLKSAMSPLKRPDGCFRDARPQGRRPLAVFYPFGHPTLYANDLADDEIDDF
jgi:hypothetical protein